VIPEVATPVGGSQRADSKVARPRIDTVVLQPTPFCNINCSYCYLPERSNKTVMKQETVALLFQNVFASGWASTHLTVIWHAGEPLVLPVDYYQAAFEAIEALRPESIQVRHAIQTNGMLITPEWCSFLKQWEVGVGVSIDGPRDLHDAHRVTRAGRGTFDKTLDGIRLLRSEAVPFHVISVLSAKSLDRPQEMLDFYKSEGIEDICFNVEESEGDHVSQLFSGGDVQARFRGFLEQFWVLSRQSPGIQFIREIDGMLPRIFRPDDAPISNSQVEPFGMLNVDCLGNVSSFSPELLGLKNPDYNDYVVGNIHTDSLEVMKRSTAMRAMARDIQAGVDRCEQECEYFSVCGGGSPVNKFAENGTFASARTSFCSLVHMVPTDLILGALDRLEQNLDQGATRLSTLQAINALMTAPRSPTHDIKRPAAVPAAGSAAPGNKAIPIHVRSSR
jgi:uncharacterized protein